MLTPVCINCEHHRQVIHGEEKHQCWHPSFTQTDFVTGETTPKDAYSMRESYCGQSGMFFVKKAEENGVRD